MRKTMQTFHELLTQGIQLLMNAGIEEARLDAWLLLEYTADISRAWYYAHPESEVNEEIVSEYLSLCQKRAEHIPLQHLTHQACFMGYDFYVDERVLVPRQDTEVLAEEALHQLRNIRNPRILDMCTGSGCLLLSLLMELPDAIGTGVDISEAALAVAERNRKNLELEKRAVLVQSDTFSGDYFQKNSGNISLEYDMLISNPPYIPTEDIGKLMEEVRFHDPVLALDGREDGLYFYRRITEQAGKYLKPGGWLMYEIGCEQGTDVSAIMQGEGFTEVTVKKDLAGLDRVVIGKKQMQEEQHV
ncbi:peptide chain release factor N(5)-glutamine methyltransferase [Blautia glucerasea]|uniref:peptide chain release factor N(5)-glutamine methyltransferase n=2 Tax=Lachnospiraceae TaxID=186803 RepID=UPI001D06EB10|nr:peptide chain release factor N(5)-glutamine methyltransferase [Blautia glucerasea]